MIRAFMPLCVGALCSVAAGGQVAAVSPATAAVVAPAAVNCEKPTEPTMMPAPNSEADMVSQMETWLVQKEALSQMQAWWRQRTKLGHAKARQPILPVQHRRHRDYSISPTQSPPSAKNEPPAQPSTLASGIEVVQWRFGDHLGNMPSQSPQSDIVAGPPVYVSMTLEGTQAAIDAMRADHQPKIQVHWVRAGGASVAGAPNLDTELTIGRPDLTDALEQQVSRQGFFEWHSWVRKDTLSPGLWTVSITDQDGKPLACGREGQPCQFSLQVG